MKWAKENIWVVPPTLVVLLAGLIIWVFTYKSEWRVVKAGNCYDVVYGLITEGSDCRSREDAIGLATRLRASKAKQVERQSLDWEIYEVPGEE